MKQFGWHILFFTTSYLVLHLFQNYAFGPEFVRYHLKDILLIPMLMFSIGIVSDLFSLKISLGNKEVFIAFIYCVLAFEMIIPGVFKAEKLDWVDIMAYAMGSVLYLLVYKHSTIGNLKQSIQNKKE